MLNKIDGEIFRNTGFSGFGFHFEVIDNAVVIYDYSKLDVSSIMTLLKSKVPNLSLKEVIYRDFEKMYSRVQMNKYGEIIGYYPLNETVLDRALNQAHRMEKSSLFKTLT